MLGPALNDTQASVISVCVCVCYYFTRETLKKGDLYVRLAVSSGESVYEPHLNEREHAREPQKRLLIKSRLLSQATRAMVRTIMKRS